MAAETIADQSRPSRREFVEGSFRVAAKRVDDSGAAFVPFQTMFDAALKIAPPAMWAAGWWRKAVRA